MRGAWAAGASLLATYPRVFVTKRVALGAVQGVMGAMCYSRYLLPRAAS